MNIYLVVAIVWALSLVGAFFKGEQIKENEMRAAHATEIEKTIKEHNENAVIDMQAAAESAAREAAARTRAQMIRSQANAVTVARPLPANCNLDAERFGLLTAAIKAANGDQADAAKRVFDAVNKANAARE